MKIAYIAHPISGDINGNLKAIRDIVRHINLTEPGTVPLVSYYVDIVSMDDDIAYERQRGIQNDIAIIKAGFITECRLYGDRISSGMINEIILCLEMGIPIVPMTEGTKKDFFELEFIYGSQEKPIAFCFRNAPPETLKKYGL